MTKEEKEDLDEPKGGSKLKVIIAVILTIAVLGGAFFVWYQYFSGLGEYKFVKTEEIQDMDDDQDTDDQLVEEEEKVEETDEADEEEATEEEDAIEEEKDEEVLKEPEVEQPASTTFNLDTLKVGDKVGTMTVASMGAFEPGFSEMKTNNVKIVFSGEVTLSGEYQNYSSDWGIMTGSPHFTVDQESFEKYMPKMINDEITQSRWFVFINKDFAKKQFEPEMTAGNATIVIDNYTFVRYPSEVGPMADLVQVISKEKTRDLP